MFDMCNLGTEQLFQFPRYQKRHEVIVIDSKVDKT